MKPAGGKNWPPTRRGCCWTKARRSTGRERHDAAVRRLPRAGHEHAARLLLDKGAELGGGRGRGRGRGLTTPTRRGCCLT